MANYEQLRAAIEHAVFTNGEHKVNASMVQGVLLDIVDTLGKGFQFLGVAGTNTAPFTTDERLFYIAPAGNYPSFGYSVRANDLALFIYDGSWRKVEFPIVGDGSIEAANIADNAVTVGKLSQQVRERLLDTYTQEQINNMLTTPDQQFVSVTATSETASVGELLPAEGDPDTIYRVGNWDGNDEETPYDTTCYSEYAWDGTQYVCLAVKHPGIDEMPTLNSSNLVESGGVFGVVEAISQKTIMDVNSVRDDTIYDANTEQFTSFTGYAVWKYLVTGGNVYYFSGEFAAGTTLYFLTWFNSSDEQIAVEPYKGNMASLVSYTDKGVKAPLNAAYALLNVVKSRSSKSNLKSTSVIMSEDLLNELNDVVQETKQNKAFIVELNPIEPSVTGNKWLSPDGVYHDISSMDVYLHDVTAGEDYLISGSLSAGNENVYLLLWLDTFGNVIKSELKANGVDGITVERLPVTAPDGAAVAAVNINRRRVNSYSFGTFGSYISLEKDHNDLTKKADLAFVSKSVQMVPDDVTDGGFWDYNTGSFKSFAGYEMRRYNVEEGNEYSFSASFAKNVTLYAVGWFDENGLLVYKEPYKGSPSQEMTFVKEKVVAPRMASYALLNVQKTRSPRYGFYRSGDVFDFNEMYEKINSSDRGNMEVTIEGMEQLGGRVVIRARYDDENDLVVVYHRGDNDQITPFESFMGSRLLTTASIMVATNKFHDWHDSTSPLRNGSNAPWHMFAQHGYEIPTVNCTHSLTSEDIGSVWTDQLGRRFTLGKISGNTLYLLPEVSGPDANGLYTRSWVNHTAGNSAISTLTDGVTTLSVTSQSYTQLKPIQEKTNFSVIVDGTRVEGNGTYMCNDLILSETLACYNPFTVETWFPTPVKNTVAIYLTQSFNIHGLSHRYDTILDVREPLVFGAYGATQGQCLVSGDFGGTGAITDGLDGYVFVPKIKKTINGNRADVPHVTASSSDDISFTRDSATLYDVNDQPDREVTFLYNPITHRYLAGFATGVSLLRGASVKAKRNQYIVIDGTGGSMSYANRNKFYVNLIRGVYFENNALPAGFVETFSTYFSYFNPESNVGQVYWYKDGNCYVIYAHYQTANTNVPISLPAEMDGLQVEVVEKTDGVTLVTDNIANGKIYVTTDSSDHNYIVLRTK